MTLALLGGVTQVKATKLYVNVDNLSWWFNDDAKLDMYSWQNEDESVNTGWDNHIIISPTYMYGGRWYVYEMPTGHDRAIVRRNVGGNISNKTWDITVSDDYYIYLKDKSEANLGWDVVSAPTWNGLCIRSSVDGYDGYTNNMECSDGNNTFTKAYTKAEFGDATYFYFRLKHIENVKFGEDGTSFDTWTQVGPTTNDTPMALATTLTTTNQFSDATYNNWQITLPTYNYEKIVITAKYIYDEGYKWKVSADAYINKTIGETGYATFGSNANVDFSKAIPATANTSFSAYKGKVQSTGSITYHETSTLYGGEGALLVGDAGTYSIPVTAAEVSADTEHNDFKAVDTKQEVDQTNGVDKTRYILTKKIVENDVNNNDAPLGFYKVNDNGSWCAANTAYLETSISPAASREYFPLQIETSGVENIKNDLTESNGTVYDLQGRRVINPKKGLYIVNGKKVIM